MKCLVVVNSKGGNTRMVANALVDSLEKAGSEAMFVDDPAAVDRASVDAAEAVLAGFWTDKGDCAPKMATFLERLSGKRVFLFGTAGFGGAPEYFERILAGVREKLPADAEYLGGVMCQGKMGPGIRRRYEGMLAEKPGDERIQAMIANFDAALAHPDDDDLARIADAARAALGL